MRTQKYSIDFDKNVLGRRTDWDMVNVKENKWQNSCEKCSHT